MPEDEATSLRRQASALKAAGDITGALRLRLELDQLYQTDNANIYQRAENLNYIAYLGLCTGQFDLAELAARESVAIYRPVAANSDEKLATFLFMLSSILAERQKFLEAMVLGQEAIGIFRKNHGDNDSFVRSCELDLQRMSNREVREYIDR